MVQAGSEASNETAGERPSQTTPTKSQPSLQPTTWEKFLAGEKLCPLCCPLWGCCCFFIIGILFTILLAGYIARVGDQIFSFEDADVKSNLIVQRAFAFEAAKGEPVGCGDAAHSASQEACEQDDKCRWDAASLSGGGVRRGGGSSSSDPSKCKTKDICDSSPPRVREMPLIYEGGPMWVSTIYEAQDNGNILDDAILEHIRSFEKSLLTDVNGAMRKNNKKSPWNQDWCRMTYPNGKPYNSTGRCAAPDSILNLFSMTPESILATKQEAEAGFCPNPVLACMCTDAPSMCRLCTVDGGVQPMSSWPVDVTDCMNKATAASSALTTTTPAPTSSSNETNVCQSARSFSLTTYLQDFCKTKPSCQWGPPKTSKVCYATSFYHPIHTPSLATGDAKAAVLEKMCDPSMIGWSQARRSQLPLSFDCVNKRTPFARTSFFAGGSSTSEDEGKTFESTYIQGKSGWYAKETELERQIEKASGDKLRIILFSAATLRSQFLNILLVDGLLSILSLVSVWLYMFWNLESAFLASVVMFEIVFSLPVAMCVWAVFLQQEILFTQLLMIYLILGIGADDAFILNDAWQQSRLEPNVKEDRLVRYAWSYRRAFKAMAVTTATTCGSFIIGAATSLPQVQAFCIFAAIVVLVDWLFCVTLFASALMVHERFIRSDKPPGTCMGPGCCCGCLKVFQQAFCKKCFGDLQKDGSAAQQRAMEAFCEGPLYRFLCRFRWPLIVFWVALVIAMSVVTGVKLRTAEKRSPIGRQSLDVIRGFEILLEEFSLFSTPTTSFVFGLDPEKPIEYGSSGGADEAKYNAFEAAKLTTEAGQLELLSLCRSVDVGRSTSELLRCEDRSCLVLGHVQAEQCVAKREVYRRNGVYITDDVMCANGRYCFMEQVARYWAFHIEGAECKGKNTVLDCSAVTKCAWDADFNLCYPTVTEDDYPGLPAAEFVSLLGSDGFLAYLNARKNLMNAYSREFDVIFDQQLTGYRLNADNSALTLAWVSFNATYPNQNSVEQANKWFDRWEAFRMKYAPTIAGFQTTALYKFMVTQNAMVQAATMGVGLSLLITYIILLLTTMNWWTSTLGLVNIIGITCVFMGLIPIVGWSLGENECIFLIAVVGLSVDYSVHLLVSYTHAKSDDRLGRTQHALSEMGISVLSSAATTLLAAAILFGCGFYFFIQFGGFVFIVIGLSILMSITFLIPLLVVLGPQNQQGDMSCLLGRCRRRSKE